MSCRYTEVLQIKCHGSSGGIGVIFDAMCVCSRWPVGHPLQVNAIADPVTCVYTQCSHSILTFDIFFLLGERKIYFSPSGRF